MATRKYYKTKAEARKALANVKGSDQLQIFKMPKGSRKAGWFVVCDYMTYLNTY